MKLLRLAAIALAAALALCALADDKPVKVACVGNSITYGYLLPDPASQAYPAILGRILGPGYEVANFGHSGATLLRRGHRPYVNQAAYKASIDFAPDIAIIHLGVNDTDPRDWPDYGDEFITDYLALIDSYRQSNPEARVLISRLTPLGAAHHRFPTGTCLWRDTINKAIERVAALSGATLIDLGRGLTDRPDLIHDAIHPDTTGAIIMAREAAASITGHRGPTRLRPIYAPGMVVQRYRPIRIAGYASAGTPVTVSLGSDSVSTITPLSGEWTVTLPPRAEQTGLALTVSAPDTVITLPDVAVGEVWIASGQSNMEFPLRSATGAEEVIAAAGDSLLRFFTMKPSPPTDNHAWSPADMARVDSLDYYSLPARWENVNPSNAPSLSAIAYFFGRQLRDSLRVPIGIIANAVGGSTAESWIDIEMLKREEPAALVNWRTNDYIQPWAQGRAKLNAPGHRHPYEPSYLFAAGIRPLGELPVAGVIWYQGESNAHNIEVHERMFPRVVESWRQSLGSPSLPFLTVQLSSLNRPSWPQFRDSQRRLAQAMQGVWMAVSSDVGDSLDVHPRQKVPVASRLARLALRNIYGNIGVEASGPEPLSAEALPGSIRILMSHADGMGPASGDAIIGFEVASSPLGPFYPASARVDGSYITLTSMQEPNPTTARYAWQPFTRANLVNSASLPASTFVISAPDTSPAPEEGIERGLSGSFASTLPDGSIILAGGCNFPTDTPLAPDAQKKFYEGIYKGVPSGSEISFTRIASLPEPMAYGATASLPSGSTLFIGGSNASGLSDKVWAFDGITLTPMPSLPKGIDNGAAAVIGHKVYLAQANTLLSLDLDHLDKGWQLLKPIPGAPRTQPVMAASGGKLYLFGGFAGRTPQAEPSLSTDGLCYDPTKNRWKPLAGPIEPSGTPLSLGGGAAATLPDGRILAVGGVNAEVFLAALIDQAPDYLSHPIDWYRFNPYACIFDPATATWSLIPSPDTARAGASLLILPSSDALILGGELKPRIRTPRPAVIPGSKLGL
ncbi:MAG: GDSL-type esterase/lipase family protein [Pseudoflavonifractor sp.]|nr:GDSL-type esterase/lipase family protein [Pseudoflavonifractor sp.]